MSDLQQYPEMLCLSMSLTSMCEILKTYCFSTKVTIAHFYCRKTYLNYQKQTLSNSELRQYLPQYCLDKRFTVTVVNMALPSLYGG